MRADQLRDKTSDELEQILEERNDALMNYRIQTTTGVVDNVRAAREARRDIARVKTILNERNRAAAAQGSGESH